MGVPLKVTGSSEVKKTKPPVYSIIIVNLLESGYNTAVEVVGCL